MAAKNDNHEMVFCILNHGVEWDPFCVEYASKSFLNWLNKTDLFWMPENAYFYAAKARNLEFLQFMLESKMGFPDERCYIIAYERGYREIVVWLNELDRLETFQLISAIREDDVEVVEYYWKEGCDINERMITDACVCGSTETLSFFIEKGFVPTRRDLIFADKMYRFDIVSLVSELLDFN